MPAQPTADYVDRDRISLSGLTRAEAREFNKFFITSFLIFSLIALIAHVVVWLWRPWAQGGAPVNVSVIDTVRPLLTMFG